MAAPRSLIVVGSAEILRELTRLAETLSWAPERILSLDPLLASDVEAAIAERRQREPYCPMGFIGLDEPSALAALSGGADEAAVYHHHDGPSLGAFIDRIELRAAQRVETQRLYAAFAHAEKLTALGTLVAGIGHEINNPLSAVMLCVDVARRQLLPALEAASALARHTERGEAPSAALLERLHEALPATEGRRDGAGLLDDMSSAVSAIASIVRDLRVFARTDDDELPELVDVRELVDHVLRLVGRDLVQHGLIERDYAADLPHLVVPRNRVTQVLMNVLVNATHAIAEIERPVHSVRISIRTDDEFVAIAISDTGPGIPVESLERIFDPFFTTKRQDLGTGLGLSISRSILRKLHGDLAVESVYGEGATFVCFLPIPTRDMIREAWRKAASVSLTVPSSAGTTVLIVDDDPRILRLYARLLNAEHRVVVAQSGREAIDLLESGSTAHLAVIELELPDDDGPRLLGWLAENRPELARRTLVVTGAEADPRYGNLLSAHRGSILHKPVRGDALLGAVAALVRDEHASPTGSSHPDEPGAALPHGEPQRAERSTGRS